MWQWRGRDAIYDRYQFPDTNPNSDPDINPGIGRSRFVGVWSGPFTLDTGQSGLTQVVITETGSITGITVSSANNQEQGPANGSINGGGVVNITFQYGSLSINCQGTLTVNSAGDTLTGTLTRSANGSPVGTVQVTLQRGSLAPA